MKKARQRNFVRQTAITRNVSVTAARIRKPVLTDARLTVVKAAAAMSARPVMTTTVITGRQSVFRLTPAAQIITTTARANVRLGLVIRGTNNPAIAVFVQPLARTVLPANRPIQLM